VDDQEGVTMDASVFVNSPNIAGALANESFPVFAHVRNVVTTASVVTCKTKLYQVNAANATRSNMVRCQGVYVHVFA
jgi:hypothetical protein